VLRALIVGRFTLPSGGRGTDRDSGEFAADIPPGRAPAPDEDPENDRSLLCGGRGTLRLLAICGALRFMVAGLLIPRLDIGDCSPRFADGVVIPRAEAGAREELAGGVMRLTVGREAIAADGCAAANPAFGPSMLARVGDTFGLAMLALERFRKALEGMFARFAPTDSPRSRVLRETAVNAPGRLA
jgi:hypothetical protein